MADRPVHVVLSTDVAPGWRWIAPHYEGAPGIAWTIAAADAPRLLRHVPWPNWGRIAAARRVRRAVRAGGVDLVVSLGPRASAYAAAIGLRGLPRVPHLAMAFNFTDLPQGARLALMRRSFAAIDRFVVFSRIERDLYARVFGLPVERFVFTHWGVQPPLAAPGPRTVERRYVAALGGEARDYRTLCDAARRLPGVRFVLVVRPHSLAGIDVPPNVEVHTNLPWDAAWSLAWHADALLVPLRSAETPNGHVTVVGGMHLGKAQVVTDSTGVRDYVTDEETALLAPAHDGAAFARAIERLLDEPALALRLAAAAQAFARAHCTEAATVECFRAQVIALTGGG